MGTTRQIQLNNSYLMAMQAVAIITEQRVPFTTAQKDTSIGTHLGLAAPISVNFNHQLAYFANQSDTTHVPDQPTAVA